MLSRLFKSALRFCTVAQLAYWTYTALVGSLNFALEMHLFGGSPIRWAYIHIFWGVIFKIAYSPVIAFIELWLRRRLLTVKGSWQQRAVDALALALCQMPVYLVASKIGGRSWSQLVTCFQLSLAEHVLFGWLHGWLLDYYTSRFAQKPAPEEVVVLAADE